MMTDEAAAVQAVADVARGQDSAARVFVTRRQSMDAQHGRDVTIGVITRPNNHSMIDAIVTFCVHSAGDYRFTGSEVSMIGDVDVDVLSIETKIYTKV